MKNIMRAISLGLVCAIATSNVAQAEELKSNFLNGVCTTGLLIGSCILLRKPSKLMYARGCKDAILHLQSKTHTPTVPSRTSFKELSALFDQYNAHNVCNTQFVTLRLDAELQLEKMYQEQRNHVIRAHEDALKKANEEIKRENIYFLIRHALAAVGFAGFAYMCKKSISDAIDTFDNDVESLKRRIDSANHDLKKANSKLAALIKKAESSIRK